MIKCEGSNIGKKGDISADGPEAKGHVGEAYDKRSGNDRHIHIGLYPYILDKRKLASLKERNVKGIVIRPLLVSHLFSSGIWHVAAYNRFFSRNYAVFADSAPFEHNGLDISI